MSTPQPPPDSEDSTLELVKRIAWRKYSKARGYPEESQFGRELVGEVAEHVWRVLLEQVNTNANGNNENVSRTVKTVAGLVLLVAAGLPSYQFVSDGNWTIAAVAGGSFLLGVLVCKLVQCVPWGRK